MGESEVSSRRKLLATAGAVVLSLSACSSSTTGRSYTPGGLATCFAQRSEKPAISTNKDDLDYVAEAAGLGGFLITWPNGDTANVSVERSTTDAQNTRQTYSVFYSANKLHTSGLLLVRHNAVIALDKSPTSEESADISACFGSGQSSSSVAVQSVNATTTTTIAVSGVNDIVAALQKAGSPVCPTSDLSDPSIGANVTGVPLSPCDDPTQTLLVTKYSTPQDAQNAASTPDTTGASGACWVVGVFVVGQLSNASPQNVSLLDTAMRSLGATKDAGC